MTKEPKNVEELRHCAVLAEKAISSGSVSSLNQIVLDEIQSLKDQFKSVNIVQETPVQNPPMTNQNQSFQQKFQNQSYLTQML